MSSAGPPGLIPAARFDWMLFASRIIQERVDGGSTVHAARASLQGEVLREGIQMLFQNPQTQGECENDLLMSGLINSCG